MGGGGKQSFTLINRGGQKSFNAEKGGSKKFLNLNTMSRVQISIFTKEDSENAISNDLATQNSLLSAIHGCASRESGPRSLTSFLFYFIFIFFILNDFIEYSTKSTIKSLNTI